MEKLVICFPAAIEGKPGTGWSLIGNVLYLGYANESKVLRLNNAQVKAVSELRKGFSGTLCLFNSAPPNAPYFSRDI